MSSPASLSENPAASLYLGNPFHRPRALCNSTMSKYVTRRAPRSRM